MFAAEGREILADGASIVGLPHVVVWDGIHQIVSRFLERFLYMGPLLFSCVFPSWKEFREVGESLLS
jgi:hypothetical protein